MRIRLVILLAAVAALAAFATVNWSEFMRAAPLSYGWGVVEAPLGLVLLAVMAASWLLLMLGSAVAEGAYERDARRNARQLEAQRDLADRAEASRFSDLRGFIENENRLAIQRENAVNARLERLLDAQHEERRQLHQAIERLDNRLHHLPVVEEVVAADGVLHRGNAAAH